MSAGFVYVLTNPAMPGLVKIGWTSGDVEVRARTLSSSTGVPAAYQVYFARRCENARQMEIHVHRKLSKHRYGDTREFFEVDPRHARHTVESADETAIFCQVAASTPSQMSANGAPASALRLQEARAAAGFRSARKAALHFGWKPSTYAAHENGQNGLKQGVAAIYAKAFFVSPAWLLFGVSDTPSEAGEAA